MKMILIVFDMNFKRFRKCLENRSKKLEKHSKEVPKEYEKLQKTIQNYYEQGKVRTSRKAKITRNLKKIQKVKIGL